MNQGAALAAGEHLLFLNDDTEVIASDWLERLLEFSQQPAVGTVGAKLFFPSGRIQHAGVAILAGRPLHPFYAHHGEHSGYFNNLLIPRNCMRRHRRLPDDSRRSISLDERFRRSVALELQRC